MKKSAIVWMFVLLALSTLACNLANRVLTTPTATPKPPPAPTEIPPTATTIPTPDPCPDGDCIISCINQLDSIVAAGGGGGETHTGGMRKKTYETDVTLVTYSVQGNSLSEPVYGSGIPEGMRPLQRDRETQRRIWEYFTAVIPLDEREFIREYIVFTDGESNILAAVSQSERSPRTWALYVDVKDATDPKELTYTLVHEFGHLLTLNPNQVKPSEALFKDPYNDEIFTQEVNKCDTYFPGEGCSLPEAYIYSFVNQFWGDIFDEWDQLNLIENEFEYYEALDEFYSKYEDQFVTDYAPTSPEEDIAESFTYFILHPKPNGESIAEQKILFFYEYPQLVQLRRQMALNLCEQLEK